MMTGKDEGVEQSGKVGSPLLKFRIGHGTRKSTWMENLQRKELG